MSETFHLELPLIAASQAQKHVTHNEALAIADAVIHPAVISRALASPPPSPSDGDRYLIAPGAGGAWSTHEGEIAFRLDGAWRFATPRTGWVLWSIAEELLLVFDGIAWRDLQDIDALQDMELVGINATADAANRLAVASANVLFTHDGGDQRIKVNRHSAADTASLLFQTGFSGRAEIGNTGDNDLHFKVSPDGAVWTDALKLDRTSGQARFVAGGIAAPGVAVGETGTGWSLSTSGRIALSGAGTELARWDSTGLFIGAGINPDEAVHVRRTGATASRIVNEAEDGGATTRIQVRSDTASGTLALNRSKGTIASPTAVTQNTTLGDLVMQAYDGATSRNCIQLRSTVIAVTPSPTDLEARVTLLIVPPGSVVVSEIARFEHASGFSMFGANPVINQNRHFRKRQYAAASLPAQNSGDEIGSSDIVAAPLVSDGTEWLSPGIKRLRAVTANTMISIPAGWAIARIFYAETAGNAVTGGIRIGTTSGATDVVAAQAIGGNSLDTIGDASILKKVFSRAAAQTLFIQAVSNWNGASVELSFVLGKVF
jgi:hypothetical protein